MTNTLPPAVRAAIDQGSLPAALAATLAHFGCQTGTVHLLREGVLKLAAQAGLPPHIAQIVETVPIGKGIAGLAAERREPITICNLQTDTSGHARPAARSTGMEGSVAVPMLAPDGSLRGVIGIAKATAHDWTEAETGLLTAIGAALPAE
jgi:putative methionine-R-sulfoxide reductase with GAF domain